MTERKHPRLPPTPSSIRHERFFSELQKASIRIENGVLHGKAGDSPRAAMRWILEFAKKELSSLSEGQWSDLRYEVESLARYGITVEGLERSDLTGNEQWPLEPRNDYENRPGDIPESVTGADAWLLQHLPSQETITALQANVRDMIERILDSERISLPLPSNTEYHVLYVPQEDRGYRYLSVKERPAAFLCNLLPLLEQYIGRIRRCPGCQAVFLADRRDQAFCQTKCQSLVNMRRYRGTTPERYGKRGRPPKPSGFKKEQKEKSPRGRRKGK